MPSVVQTANVFQTVISSSHPGQKEKPMKKYEYVKISTKTGLLSTKNTAHRDIIDEYAARGYRYVGWFPSKMSNMLSGVLEEVELIFETDV